MQELETTTIFHKYKIGQMVVYKTNLDKLCMIVGIIITIGNVIVYEIQHDGIYQKAWEDEIEIAHEGIN